MPSRYMEVEWLDRMTRPLDLETCEEWPASWENPLCPRLYRTPGRRWVLDAGGRYLEIAPENAATMLLRWGWTLPGELLRALQARETAESPPGPLMPLPVARAKDDLVILYEPQDEPLVHWKPKSPLGPIRHKIIKTLIEAGDSGLSLAGLIKGTKHGGAQNTLRDLAARDEDWASVIQLPGPTRTGRYRIGRPGYRHPAAEAS